jgi:5-enolpyruvylshikimate-3-phosphate synthase
MQHDVAVARTEQRKQLEVAAEPYVRAVQSVHARTAQALEALQSRAGDESRRVRALEATMVTTSRRLLQMTLEVHARERALGVDAEAAPDGMRIRGNPGAVPTGAPIASDGDHRIAMAFAIAGLRVGTTVTDTACIATSYPSFPSTLARLSGA